jgi:hypothetical protein
VDFGVSEFFLIFFLHPVIGRGKSSAIALYDKFIVNFRFTGICLCIAKWEHG